MSVRPYHTPESSRIADVSARPIRLADGERWGFATPTLRLSPRVEVEPDTFGRPVERIVVDVKFGYPLAIERQLDEVRSACAGEPVARQYEAFFALASTLLRRAHNIDLPDACALLEVSGSQLAELVSAVMGVVVCDRESLESECRGGDAS